MLFADFFPFPVYNYVKIKNKFLLVYIWSLHKFYCAKNYNQILFCKLFCITSVNILTYRNCFSIIFLFIHLSVCQTLCICLLINMFVSLFQQVTCVTWGNECAWPGELSPMVCRCRCWNHVVDWFGQRFNNTIIRQGVLLWCCMSVWPSTHCLTFVWFWFLKYIIHFFLGSDR